MDTDPANFQNYAPPAAIALPASPERRSQVPSPARMWLLTSLFIFLTEWLIMFGIERVWHLPEVVEIWADPAALVLTLTPLLYFFLFRPMATQIAVRQKSEEDLRYSEQKYATLVEHSPTGIFMVRGRSIVFANPAFASIVGCPGNELLHAAPYALVHPEDRARVEEIGAARLAGKAAPAEYECRLVRPDGEMRWVTLRPAVILYREGVSILSTVLDITDRKKAEEELLQATSSLRELSARVLAAQEEERRQVARELHDGVGQSLSAVKFIVERLVTETDRDGNPAHMLLLRPAVRAIQTAVDEVRTMSMGLRPSILDDLGLAATIHWVSREFGAAHPEMHLDRVLAVTEEDVPDWLKIVIFRVLQEALNNAGKHSGAGKLLVKLEVSGGELVLRVEDDGQGFDPADARSGHGLRNMRERTELSGGRFSLASSANGGTAIRAQWPLSG